MKWWRNKVCIANWTCVPQFLLFNLVFTSEKQDLLNCHPHAAQQWKVIKDIKTDFTFVWQTKFSELLDIELMLNTVLIRCGWWHQRHALHRLYIDIDIYNDIGKFNVFMFTLTFSSHQVIIAGGGADPCKYLLPLLQFTGRPPHRRC